MTEEIVKEFVYISDLHLDISGFDISILCQEENKTKYLCIIGDTLTTKICGALEFKKLMDKVSPYFIKVFIVLGNHDYYGYTLDEALEQVRLVLSVFSNVIVLDHRTPYIEDDVYIFGDTFWTDVPPFAELAIQSLSDYRNIFSDLDNGWLKVYETNMWNVCARESLYQFLTDYKDCKKLVLTHFPPLLKGDGIQHTLLDCYFGNTSMCKFFDDDIIPNYWLYAHVHQVIESEIGSCGFKTNPHGYGSDPYQLRSVKL